MKKLLMVIDPQIDFITGSLPVPGGEEAMDALSEYIRHNGDEYGRIIVTADRHPMRHCSFKNEGGEWPRHCIADSVGAAIWPPIMSALLESAEKVRVLHKGEDEKREEYSIFKNAAASDEILRIIDGQQIGQIDICGLAGDICVADTIRDGIALMPSIRINVLTEFSPSLDGGRTLRSLAPLLA